MKLRKYWLVMGLTALAAACSGAAEQDVLSNQIGSSTASSGAGGTSGTQTSSGNTSGQTTSGDPGTSGGTTSGSSGTLPGNCVQEGDDSKEKRPIQLTGCAKGTLRPPIDESDFLRYERPKGMKMELHYTGVVKVRIFDEKGDEHSVDDIPNNEGSYLVQLDYDYENHPLSGDDLRAGLTFEWSFSIAFTK